MEMQSQTTKIYICIIVNVILIFLLYNIPVDNNSLLENLCIFKMIFGKECWNCGMTRAFLSILHTDFDKALYYNHNSIIVFPFTVFIYIYSWYKFILKKDNHYEL